MEHPRVGIHGQEWDDADDERNVRHPRLRSFCLQKYIERDHDVTFLTLWRCKPRRSRKHGDMIHDNVSEKHCARSFYKRPLPLLSSDMSSKCDLFLFKAGEEESASATTAPDEDEYGAATDGFDREDDQRNVSLVHLDLESQTLFEDALSAHGFDEDVIIPQLYYMKLTASEILNRLNRGLHARQVSGELPNRVHIA